MLNNNQSIRKCLLLNYMTWLNVTEYIPFVVIAIWSFPRSWHIIKLFRGVTWRIPLVKQKLFSLPEQPFFLWTAISVCSFQCSILSTIHFFFFAIVLSVLRSAASYYPLIHLLHLQFFLTLIQDRLHIPTSKYLTS